MNKQITKEEALRASERLFARSDVSGISMSNKKIIDKYIEQDVEAKSLEEIKEEFERSFKLIDWSDYPQCEASSLHRALVKKFIKNSFKQYAASKDKEIAELKTIDKANIEYYEEKIETLGKDLITVIEQKKEYIQENAKLKKEIEQLRVDLSEMANKIELRDINLFNTCEHGTPLGTFCELCHPIQLT